MCPQWTDLEGDFLTPWRGSHYCNRGNSRYSLRRAMWGVPFVGKWDIASIEAAFVEAAIDPSRWNAAMETASDVIGVAGAALFPIRGRLPLMPHSERLAEGFDIYIRDGWIDRDERYRAVPAAS